MPARRHAAGNCTPDHGTSPPRHADYRRQYGCHLPFRHTTVEYPSPNRKKTGTTEQALSTNQKPEPHVMRLPSEFPTLATPLHIYCISSMSFSGWLLTFSACHWNAERHSIGCGQVVQHVCALIRRHCRIPEP
ncbi:unnamed protein product [Mesocestoides corti]|uniref:Uncharacterized protein n=1 Tax=Mesocestoides corti TaxID=53468 RepID=A0A0R3UG47_MESCO|nr:unnamed protein product [Mesocestoides corti]